MIKPRVEGGMSRAQPLTQHDELPPYQIERMIDHMPASRATGASQPHQSILFELPHQITATFLRQLH
jgi:hypothetical protein